GDDTGSFSSNANVPGNATPGTIPIAGVGQMSHTSATFKFIVYTPTLALAPQGGSARTTLTLSAYGFHPSENVQIFWNNGTTPLLTGTTDTYGYLAPATITVPDGTPPGAYLVNAVGQTSQISIQNTFTVVA